MSDPILTPEQVSEKVARVALALQDGTYDADPTYALGLLRDIETHDDALREQLRREGQKLGIYDIGISENRRLRDAIGALDVERLAEGMDYLADKWQRDAEQAALVSSEDVEESCWKMRDVALSDAANLRALAEIAKEGE